MLISASASRFVVWSLVVISPATLHSQDMSIADFRSQVEPAWKKLRDVSNNLTVIADNSGDRSRVIYNRSGNDVLVAETDIPDTAKGIVPLRGIMATNAQYQFWIFERKDNTWKLNVLEMNRPNTLAETTTQIRQRYSRISNPWNRPGIHGDLYDSLENPKCNWTMPKRVRYKGRECVEATLEERYKYQREANESTVTKTCVFDPDNGWSLLLSTSTVKPPQPKNIPLKCVVTVEYGNLSIDGLRFPIKLADACQYREGAESHVVTYTFQDVSKCKLSPEEYYLTNYDLPEPIGMSPPSSRGYLSYIIIASIVFGLSSIVFSYLRRQSTRKGDAATQE